MDRGVFASLTCVWFQLIMMGLPNFLFVLLAILRSLFASFSASQSNLAPESNITYFNELFLRQIWTSFYFFLSTTKCDFTIRIINTLLHCFQRNQVLEIFLFVPLASPLSIHEKPPSISSSESITMLPCSNYIRIELHIAQILRKFKTCVLIHHSWPVRKSPVYECLLVLLAFLLRSSWMCFVPVSLSSSLQLVSLGIKMSLRF